MMADSGKAGAILLRACAYDNISIVKSLLKNGAADVNYKNESGVSPLMNSLANAQLVQILCESSARVDELDNDGKSALIHASENGYVGSVKVLIDYRAQVDLQECSTGYTPLIVATLLEQYETVKVLLEHGSARVDIQDNDGMTALLNASMLGQTDIVKLLLKHHAQIDLQDHEGLSSLMLASMNGHVDTVKSLLENHAKVNLQDNENRSALMLASSHGRHETVQLLLEHDASVDLPDADGITPLVEATLKGHDKVVKVLQQHGAESTILCNIGALTKLDKESSEPSTKLKPPPKPNGPNLSDALRKLIPLAHEWHNIGVILITDSTKLNNIETDYKKCNDCLREMLQEWLRQTSPAPTWEELADAVEPFNMKIAVQIRSMTKCNKSC